MCIRDSPNRRQVTRLSPELQELYDSYTGSQRSLMNIVTGNFGRKTATPDTVQSPGQGGSSGVAAGGTTTTGDGTATGTGTSTGGGSSGPQFRAVTKPSNNRGGTSVTTYEEITGDYDGPRYEKLPSGKFREISRINIAIQDQVVVVIEEL